MKDNKRLSKNPVDCDYLKTSSTQDCTGLIPAGITSEEELENYQDLYPFLPYTAEKEPKKGSLR